MARIVFSCASSKPLGLLPTARYYIKAIDPAEMIILICLSWYIHTNPQCSAASLPPTYAFLEQVTPRSKNNHLLAALVTSADFSDVKAVLRSLFCL